MPVEVICERSGRGKATIMSLLPAEKEFSSYQVPRHKFGRGRKRKTARLTGTIMKRELQKYPYISALALQNIQPQLLQQVEIRTIQHLLEKDLDPLSRKAAN